MSKTVICLRCGQALPDGSSQSRRYCDVCAAERNRELTRERLRKGYERKRAEDLEKKERKDRAYCRKCEYYGSESYGGNLCDYLLRTGHRRGCKAGVGCIRRETGE